MKRIIAAIVLSLTLGACTIPPWWSNDYQPDKKSVEDRDRPPVVDR